MPDLRQTGAYHVHGVWVQRSRHCGVPHHRFSARTAHCHFDQQFCALQRPFPDVLPKGKKKNGFMYCQDMFKIVYFYKHIEHDINLRKTAEKPRKFAIYTNIAPKTKSILSEFGQNLRIKSNGKTVRLKKDIITKQNDRWGGKQ